MAKQKMGSKKRPIQLIEEPSNRMITYAKRRAGLLKKAYELSVLCESDMALLMASPSQKLTCFAGPGETRIEDVLTKFVELPDDERGFPLEDKEQLYRLLEKVKAEDSCATIQCGVYNNQFVQDNLQKILQLQDEIEKSEEQLRLYYPEPIDHKTVEELEICEEKLLEAMDRVSERMHYLSSRSSSSNDQQLFKNQIQEQNLSSTSKLQDIQDNYEILDNDEMASRVYENKSIPSQLLSSESMFQTNGEGGTYDNYAQTDLMAIPDKTQLLSSPSTTKYEGFNEELKGSNGTSQ